MLHFHFSDDHSPTPPSRASNPTSHPDATALIAIYTIASKTRMYSQLQLNHQLNLQLVRYFIEHHRPHAPPFHYAIAHLSEKKRNRSTSFFKIFKKGENSKDLLPVHTVVSQPSNTCTKSEQSQIRPKVRGHLKGDSTFAHLMMVQELSITPHDDTTDQSTGYDVCHGLASEGNSRAFDKDSSAVPVWVLKFSHDGLYLAAGSHDGTKVVQHSKVDRRRFRNAPDSFITINSARELASAPNTPRPSCTNQPSKIVFQSLLQTNSGTIQSSTNLANNASPSTYSMDIFEQKAMHVFKGHTQAITAISWSKGGFIVSASMDRTESMAYQLCRFSLRVSPSRYSHKCLLSSTRRSLFLRGIGWSCALWSIHEKSKVLNELHRNATFALAFNRDGTTVIVGTVQGDCVFYESEGLNGRLIGSKGTGSSESPLQMFPSQQLYLHLKPYETDCKANLLPEPLFDPSATLLPMQSCSKSASLNNYADQIPNDSTQSSFSTTAAISK
ncbi:hypothetical protein BSLG_006007 [Batrachochytrium salamandrivorans]|nr:hypothetical protein BSLG_006007 [Batrachochytrium salamandrivorans]